ncbi:hypothetical protein L3V82_10690 [Thiotrichales bacterium 19S3-7]|nr:hypothetical protein [Thiotrichales bacterium 19S3-7]MCF6802624.1 hypothetical protein [Thiotrichales bacterium 19S3-11]
MSIDIRFIDPDIENLKLVYNDYLRGGARNIDLLEGIDVSKIFLFEIYLMLKGNYIGNVFAFTNKLLSDDEVKNRSKNQLEAINHLFHQLDHDILGYSLTEDVKSKISIKIQEIESLNNTNKENNENISRLACMNHNLSNSMQQLSQFSKKSKKVVNFFTNNKYPIENNDSYKSMELMLGVNEIDKLGLSLKRNEINSSIEESLKDLINDLKLAYEYQLKKNSNSLAIFHNNLFRGLNLNGQRQPCLTDSNIEFVKNIYLDYANRNKVTSSTTLNLFRREITVKELDNHIEHNPNKVISFIAGICKKCPDLIENEFIRKEIAACSVKFKRNQRTIQLPKKLFFNFEPKTPPNKFVIDI